MGSGVGGVSGLVSDVGQRANTRRLYGIDKLSIKCRSPCLNTFITLLPPEFPPCLPPSVVPLPSLPRFLDFIFLPSFVRSSPHSPSLPCLHLLSLARFTSPSSSFHLRSLVCFVSPTSLALFSLPPSVHLPSFLGVLFLLSLPPLPNHHTATLYLLPSSHFLPSCSVYLSPFPPSSTFSLLFPFHLCRPPSSSP